jgi:hypothetical protein
VRFADLVLWSDDGRRRPWPISFLISSSLIKSPFKTLGVILSLDQDQYQLALTREAALEARDMKRASMAMAAE